MIQKSHIIDPSQHEHKIISFGSSVKILDLENDKEELYTLCGVTESEPENGLISIHSPIAKALLGKKVDEQIRVRLPQFFKEYEIIEIFYKNIFTLKTNIRTHRQFAIH